MPWSERLYAKCEHFMEQMRQYPVSPFPSSVWVKPKSPIDGYFALDAHGLAVASISDPGQIASVSAAIQGGTPTINAVGKSIKFVPYDKITGASANISTGFISLAHTAKGKKDAHWLDFPKEHTAEFLSALKERLPGQWLLVQRRLGWFEASLKPVIALLACMIFTWFCWFAATTPPSSQGQQTVHGGRSGLVMMLLQGFAHMLGPTGVLIVGGAIAGLILRWMARRVMNPPDVAKLTPVKD